MHDIQDDVLFKVMEMQSSTADQFCKKGRLRPASASLDRAFKEGKARANAGQPAGRVACASVRLQSCAMLSRFKKHSEALEEACAAVLEMDTLWKELTISNGVAQAAVRDHRVVAEALKRLPPGLQNLMQNPPKWLEQAITVSVEAKHCVALELEYCVLAEEPIDLMASHLHRPASAVVHGSVERQPTTSSRPQSAPAGSNIKARAASSGASMPDAARALSLASAGGQHLEDPWGLIERLHSEGLALAESLLPSRHAVLESSKRTEEQACLRNPAIAARLVQEERVAAEAAAEAARLRAAEEAERKAAEEAAQRAAEEEVARRAAEEAARLLGEWHANRELGEERAEQLVEQRERLESPDNLSVPAAAASSEEQAVEATQSMPADPCLQSDCQILEPSEQRTGRSSAQPAVMVDLMPQQEFLCSKRGISLPAVCSREDHACLETKAVIADEVTRPGMQRPASALPRSASAAGQLITPEVEQSNAMRPATAGAARRPLRGASSPMVRDRDKGTDIFKQWKAEQISYNQLSYLQKKMASDAGVEDMKVYFRRERQRFEGYVKDTNPDELYDIRVNFTPSMVAEKKRQQGRLEELADEACPVVDSTVQLQQAMRRTWKSLYGFREEDRPVPKRHFAGRDLPRKDSFQDALDDPKRWERNPRRASHSAPYRRPSTAGSNCNNQCAGNRRPSSAAGPWRP